MGKSNANSAARVFDSRMGMSNFGYLVKTKKREELELPLGLHAKELKSTSCIHTIVMADEDFHTTTTEGF